MTDPVEGGEIRDDASSVATAQLEAPASTTTSGREQPAAQPKGRAASGASEPSPKTGVPPPQQGKQTAETKTDPPAKPPLKKDPKHEAKLAFLAGEAESTEPEPGKKPETKTVAKPGAKPASSGTPPPAAEPKAGEQPPEQHVEDNVPADPKAAREAFARMRRELKEAKTERETIAPDAELGRLFSGILKSHQVAEDFNVVRDDEVAGVIKIQAALNRAAVARANGQTVAANDLAVIQGAIASLVPVAKDLGLERQAAAPLQVKPFVGKLPDDLRQIVDAEWMPEERLRKLYALELAHDAAEKSAAAAPAQQPPPAPARDERARQPAALQRRDAAPAPQAATADEQIYIGKSRAFLAAQGVPAGAGQAEHYKTKLVPIIVHDLLAGRLPQGVDPLKTWVAASPQTKHELIVEAQQLYAERNAPAPAPTTPAAPQRQVLFQRNFARGPGRNRSTATPADPKGRLAFLSGEGAQE